MSVNITARGKTNFGGKKRSVRPISTMQTKVRIMRAFSHWNSQDGTSPGVPSNHITSFFKALLNTSNTNRLLLTIV